MAADKSIKLTLTVEGQFGVQPLQPFTTIYQLTGHKFDWEHGVAVGPADVAVSRAIPSLGTQSLLLILSDQDVVYRLNGEVTNRLIKRGAAGGGFAVHPGTPNVTTVEFDGNGSSEASVRLIALGTS